MGLLAPTALILLPILAIIAALYFLRLRRQETQVSSLFLWQSLLRDREANAPWQRLRASLLLLLQLVIAAALIFALARPWTSAKPDGGTNLVIVLDASASMASVDEPDGKTRLQAARDEAWRRIGQLPTNGQAALIVATTSAQVLAPATSDRAALRNALDSITVAPTATDLSAALLLASSVAGGMAQSEVLVLSDGVFPDPRAVVKTVAGTVTYKQMGNRGANQGIVGLAVERTAGNVGLFAQVFNGADAAVERRLDIEIDGVAWAGRRLDLPAGEKQQVVLDDLPLDARVIHATLAGADDNGLDDQAWVVNRLAQPAPVLMVTDGNRFLQNALVLLPNVQLSRMALAAYAPMVTATLTVFDSIVPTTTLPAGNLLFINPPHSSPLFAVSGVISNPVPLLDASATEPLLRHTDFSSVHIEQARLLAQPSWGHVVLNSDQGPLIIAGEIDGRKVGIITFDLHDSDLPVQISFPLLMRNLVSYLLPDPTGGLPDVVSSGQPVLIPIDSQLAADRITVEGPDGAILADYQTSDGGGAFNFDATTQLGLYIVHYWLGPNEVQRDGFAVNLFSADESYTLPVLSPPMPPGVPVVGVAASGSESARWDWWQPLALLALIVLVAEWLAVHSLGLRRLLAPLALWRERFLLRRHKEPA